MTLQDYARLRWALADRARQGDKLADAALLLADAFAKRGRFVAAGIILRRQVEGWVHA